MIEKEREKVGQKSWNEAQIIAAIKGRVGMHCEGHVFKVDMYQVWGAVPLNEPLHTLLTCRFIKSKRNPPTVVLVRVRASSMMVETPKSPVDNKLQYDQKYFNNLAFLILQISSLLDSEWPTYLLKYCHLQQEKCYLVWDLCQSYSKHKKEKL